MGYPVKEVVFQNETHFGITRTMSQTREGRWHFRSVKGMIQPERARCFSEDGGLPKPARPFPCSEGRGGGVLLSKQWVHGSVCLDSFALPNCMHKFHQLNPLPL